MVDRQGLRVFVDFQKAEKGVFFPEKSPFLPQLPISFSAKIAAIYADKCHKKNVKWMFWMENDGKNEVHPTFGVMIHRNNNLAIAATFFYYLNYKVFRKLIAMMYLCHQIVYSN